MKNLIACDRSQGTTAMPVSTAGHIIAAPGPTYLVTADAPKLIGERLDAAEHLARQQALKEGVHGILVTRHGPTTFTVALSADVPYGVTMEHELVYDTGSANELTGAVMRTAKDAGSSGP